MRICSSCGAQIEDDALFCEDCGQSVSAPGAAAQGVAPPPVAAPPPYAPQQPQPQQSPQQLPQQQPTRQQYGQQPPYGGAGQQPQQPPYGAPQIGVPQVKKSKVNIIIPVCTAAVLIIAFLVLWFTGVITVGKGSGGPSGAPQTSGAVRDRDDDVVTATPSESSATPAPSATTTHAPRPPETSPDPPTASPGNTEVPATTATATATPDTPKPTPPDPPTEPPKPPADNWAAAYLEVIDDLIRRHGEGAVETISEWETPLMTGVCMLRLIDFDNDGNYELYCAWLDSPRPFEYPLLYKQAVYGYNGGLVTLMAERPVSNPGTDVSPSVKFLSKYGRVLIVDINEICFGSYIALEDGVMHSVLDYYYDFWDNENHSVDGYPATEDDIWYIIAEMEVMADIEEVYFFSMDQDEARSELYRALETIARLERAMDN